jgi:hypothetical protein
MNYTDAVKFAQKCANEDGRKRIVTCTGMDYVVALPGMWYPGMAIKTVEPERKL